MVAGQRPKLSTCDEAAGEFEEGLMDVGTPLPTDAEPSVPMQPGESPFHDPAVGAQPTAMTGAAAGDGRHDPLGVDLRTVDVVIVSAVGEE
ncbi:hypothetical protein GCM10010329_84530 [Streptomyces spiroverticillatus]|uniref:Uncharacterized protein n=1 Tax=Streptomyces finlayi TaxID=67296 RepID=A0A918X989_9ACTN|nr:hypothetical protein GCM10010329_84530 [Streptomyces spiroverticillatus]GHD19326.1 hypothetical protein GCM10010334_82850 [Streptomyces finlayi]